MSHSRLLERFLRYVAIDTTAQEDVDVYPSSPGQFTLGKLLVEELHAMGIGNAKQDQFGIVIATIESNVDSELPTVAFNAHLDTSPETTGANVKPQIVENYAGGDLPLAGDPSRVIRVAENPSLEKLHGCTLITTDGTTLLGADDKAGLAIIMELAQHLIENRAIEHGPIRILFTCDEEIGLGVKHIDVNSVNATVCYTFDGGGANDIDAETFSADMASITVRGVNIHPSIAKDKMVNALRAAGDFLSRLPTDLSPEKTSGREGFLHPYTIEGGVAEVFLKVLLRDFETDALVHQAALLNKIAREVESEHPGSQVEVVVSKQYRNMAEGLTELPEAVDYAELAHQRLGRTARRSIVRGGTDGSQFTELGLPTPNLSSGQHNQHSPLEWACLDEMVAAVEVGIELVKVWREA